jgi:protein-disulfide isomerase
MVIEKLTLSDFKKKFRVNGGKATIKSSDGFKITEFTYSEVYCDLCGLEINENFPDEKTVFIAENLVYCNSCFKKRSNPKKLHDLTIAISKLRI